MATIKTLDTLYVNGVAYKVAQDSNIKLQINNVDVSNGNFTLNQASDKAINLEITKTTVGLGNVDNTSDSAKPVSAATQTALDAKQDILTSARNAGTNITITADPQTGDPVISAIDTTYDEVTELMLEAGSSTTPGVISAKAVYDFVAGKIAGVYRVKGSVPNLSDLPTSSSQEPPVVGDVWNIQNAFTKDGASYPAGTNVVYVETSQSGVYDWDPMGGTIDLSPFFNKSLDDADDIDDTNSNNKFTNATDIARLANTSGTNTGDQSASDFDIKDLADTTGLRTTWSGKQDAFYQTAASAPSTATATEGDQYYNTTDDKLYVYDGTQWKAVDEDARAAWGNISGTLSNQTDLQTALNGKVNTTDLGNGTITVNTIDLDGSGSHTEGSFTTNQAADGTLNVRSSVIVSSTGYTSLPSSKESDNNFYFTFTSKEV